MNGQRVLDVDDYRTQIIISDNLDNPTYVYLMQADPGTSPAATGWKITKYIFTGTTRVDRQYANGDSGYNHVANSYAGYSYA